MRLIFQIVNILSIKKDEQMESKMNKNDLKVQKASNNKTHLANSKNDCCADSNRRDNFSHDQIFFDKIGVRNPHPWSLIGLR